MIAFYLSESILSEERIPLATAFPTNIMLINAAFTFHLFCFASIDKKNSIVT